MQEEKIAAVQQKLEHAEQELAQFSKLPEIEEQLKQRMEALTQVMMMNTLQVGNILLFDYNSDFFRHKCVENDL